MEGIKAQFMDPFTMSVEDVMKPSFIETFKNTLLNYLEVYKKAAKGPYKYRVLE
jgi:hypothetical protein